jgi:Amt family ammonium transporter
MKNTKAADTVYTMYALVSAAFVFFMQAGFALLETGSIRKKNHTNILLKNATDITLGAIIFYFLGFGFAYGNHYDKEGNAIDRDDGEEWNAKKQFIGGSLFAAQGFELVGGTFYQEFCFQFVFASAAATIVSGSVAERCRMEFYMIFSLIMTGFIYPCIVNWTWGGGWLTAGDGTVGFYDFAGSGIVHLTGGIAGLVAAIILGPRIGKYPDSRRVGSYDNSGKDKDTDLNNVSIENMEDVANVRKILLLR